MLQPTEFSLRLSHDLTSWQATPGCLISRSIRIDELVEQHRELLLEGWNDFFHG